MAPAGSGPPMTRWAAVVQPAWAAGAGIGPRARIPAAPSRAKTGAMRRVGETEENHEVPSGVRGRRARRRSAPRPAK